MTTRVNLDRPNHRATRSLGKQIAGRSRSRLPTFVGASSSGAVAG